MSIQSQVRVSLFVLYQSFKTPVMIIRCSSLPESHTGHECRSEEILATDTRGGWGMMTNPSLALPLGVAWCVSFILTFVDSHN